MRRCVTICLLSHYQDPTLVALLDTGAPPRLELGYEQREPPSVRTLSYANHCSNYHSALVGTADGTLVCALSRSRARSMHFYFVPILAFAPSLVWLEMNIKALSFFYELHAMSNSRTEGQLGL